ncbi:zinc ribbon domain-containing protein [Alkalibacillus salilacus]|uniref:RNA polymerase subunit RPABC4/transcription elongation factor Spt4/TM2 domain-containing membrane protein YozV n=1 Tax=Alkalibacillus salilacus TaxID=284582 RepID=A0ABT9VHS1_9BACI|nr:zinc ribbon domain-containing protein [Alkalibacillus salilacus]MDQ0160457.1 RNA polymerase subunit RPABC4/transcription elongation factor Spt4/TM2 domain-containing membrane protein YozV [Alkalibacillus salilacus]
MYCPNCAASISDKAELCPNCGVRPFREVNYCFNCSESINANQEMCISCGVRVHKKVSTSVSTGDDSKPPWLMALVSFFVSGLGQMVIGQLKKGFAILAISMVLGFMTFGASAIITTPFAVIDAYLVSKKVADGRSIDEWEFF